MAATNGNDNLYIKARRIFSEMFTGTEKQQGAGPQDLINRNLVYGSTLFTKEELTRILNPDGDIATDDNNITDMMTFVKDTLSSSRRISNENEELVALSPELKQAGKLLIASILSPDDLQNNSLSFTQNHPLLTPITNSAIADLISTHMCETRKLHKLLPKWLYNILLGSGSAPILIIPNSNNRILDDLSIQFDIVHNNDISNIAYRNKTHKDTDIIDFKKTIFSTPKNKVVSLNSFSDIIEKPDLLNKYRGSVIDLFPDNNGIWVDEKTNLRPFLNAFDKDDSIIVSDNFTTIGKMRKNLAKAEARINEIMSSRFLGRTSDIYKLDDSLMLAEGDHPTMLPLDAEIVIPVTVPGSRSEHVGYFVIVDDFGSPMASQNISYSDATTDEVASSTFNVMFDGSSGMRKLSTIDKNLYATTIFNIALKQMIESKLTEMGLSGSKLDMFNNVSRFIFQNFLHNNKVRLVFVPAQLMTYIALEHRPDGTGKSRLEDGAKLVLALKNALIVSNVMAAMTAAMPQKTLTVDIPSDTTNVTKLFEDIYNIHSQKKTFNGASNPIAISKGIADQHLTIIPKGIPGLEGLESIEESARPHTRGEENEGLIERLDRQSCTCIGVPSHTLSRLGEIDLATSITSNNLLFSASVRTDQKDITTHLTKLVQTELTYSEPLQRQIVNLISKDSNVAKDILKTNKDAQKETEEAREDGKVTYSLINAVGNADTELNAVDMSIINILKDVINGVFAVLPAPNMVVDNARFDELEKFITTAEKVAEKICNPELLPIDDRDAEKVITSTKAQVVRNLMQDYITAQGFDGVFAATIKDDFDITSATDLFKFIKNVQAAVQDYDKVIKEFRKPAEDAASDGGSQW